MEQPTRLGDAGPACQDLRRHRFKPSPSRVRGQRRAAPGSQTLQMNRLDDATCRCFNYSFTSLQRKELIFRKILDDERFPSGKVN